MVNTLVPLLVSLHWTFVCCLPSACLKTLQRIAESCPNDTKVLFNIALTEYAMSGFQKTDLFKSQVQKIAERVRAALRSIETRRHRLLFQLNCNLDNAATLEEPDQCTIFYNTAVLLYQMRQYHSALAITEKLFRLVGQIGKTSRCNDENDTNIVFARCLDEALSWKICILLAELDLCTFQVSRSVAHACRLPLSPTVVFLQPESALAAVVHLEKLLNERSNPPTTNGLSSHSPSPSSENLELLKTRLGLVRPLLISFER